MNTQQIRKKGERVFNTFSRYDYFEELVQKYPDIYTPTELKKTFSDNFQVENEKDWKQ